MSDLTSDLTICRTHNGSRIPDDQPGACFAVPRDRNNHYEPTEPCDPVRLVWSADGHALLEVEECDECLPPKGDGKGTVCLGYHPQTDDGPGEYEWGPCPRCGGSGWRYTDEPIDDPWSDKPGARVAVVPLKGTT